MGQSPGITVQPADRSLSIAAGIPAPGLSALCSQTSGILAAIQSSTASMVCGRSTYTSTASTGGLILVSDEARCSAGSSENFGLTAITELPSCRDLGSAQELSDRGASALDSVLLEIAGDHLPRIAFSVLHAPERNPLLSQEVLNELVVTISAHDLGAGVRHNALRKRLLLLDSSGQE